MSELIADLKIESLVFGGSGLGRHTGKVVFVPGAVPGDRVLCRIMKAKKRFAEGRLEQILQPSADRCLPKCPVFGDCGGCQWQHLPYPLQCAWKERIFADLLQRQAGVDGALLKPLVAATDPWHYRSRAQLKVRRVGTRLAMGFYRRGSHFVVDHLNCPILHPQLNWDAQQFRRWLVDLPTAHRIPQLDLGIGDNGQRRAVLHCLDDASQGIGGFLQPLAASIGVALYLQSGRKDSLRRMCGDEDLYLEAGDPPLRLAYGPGGFAQINLDQNRVLVQAVVEAVKSCQAYRVLDLYCGMGNLSLPVARVVEQVVGVEDFAPAIDKARQNALTNGIRNAVFHARPAEGAIHGLAQNGPGFDLVLLDPPRCGAYRVVKELIAASPRYILYVSCDPSTLARDLQHLLHNGYEMQWSQPFDLFPQTHHIESLSLLRRRTAAP